MGVAPGDFVEDLRVPDALHPELAAENEGDGLAFAGVYYCLGDPDIILGGRVADARRHLHGRPEEIVVLLQVT